MSGTAPTDVRSSGPAWPSQVRLGPIYEDPPAKGRLSAALRECYRGDLGFHPLRLYANFISSLDDVVAIDPMLEPSGRVISGRSPADRFVMGLLRVLAKAVLVAAGALRASPDELWLLDTAFPAALDAFSQLGRHLGYPPTPWLVIVTASGHLDPSHPGLERGALVLTTMQGARNLQRRLPTASTVVTFKDAVGSIPGASWRRSGPRAMGSC